MSLKRPLSPESNNNSFVNNDTRQLKRLKLHSIIQQLRDEETKLLLLKRLHTNQQLASSPRTNKTISSTISNENHLTKKISSITVPTKSVQLPINNTSLSQQQQHQQLAARKTSNSPLLTTALKQPTTIQSYEERKNQAKSNLRKQLERDLLNIQPPKPTLQDITFVPNGSDLSFQPTIGLEDVVQCLAELQADRQRLPQRFTDRAHVQQPFICDQCGTDFTIRWWTHMNTKISNEITNILCDRCKKQILRRTAKSEHSTLLKNVFLSAIKQEKDIDKTYQALIKQEKLSSKTKTFVPSQTYTSSQHQIKNNTIPTTTTTTTTKKHTTNPSRTVVQQQQQTRTTISVPQHHMKTHALGKISKQTMKSQGILPHNYPISPQQAELFNAFLASNLVKPASSKRRTYPTVQFK